MQSNKRSQGEDSSNSDKRQKRSIACLRCRRQKLKCEFTGSDKNTCDRCKKLKRNCTVENKMNDKEWKDQTDDKINRLESSINNLLTMFEKVYQNRDQQSPQAQVLESSQSTSDESLREGAILGDHDVKKILEFFNKNLSKYLPIFIFDYIPLISKDIIKVSKLLYWSILSVTSLYIDEFHSYHEALLAEFKKEVGSLSPSDIFDKDGLPYNLIQNIHDMLGCIIAAAWLGNDLGVRCCIIASDLAGRLNPQILERMDVEDKEKRAAFAFSLTSYIIERRLQISYTRADFIDMKNEMAANRDYFLPLYLNRMFTPDNEANPVSTEYKVNANVELCAITMVFQTELGKRQHDISNEEISHWSVKLNMWLADWIGRLTTHLDISSVKPLLLTFHFAKLFLYVQAINNIESCAKTDVNGIFTRSEGTALDIIEMLLLDRDIRRLITMGPIFYPTIFVTAAALLLKIVTIGPKYQYKVNEAHLTSTSEQAYKVLKKCVSYPMFPCHATIETLGDGIRKVKERSIIGSSDDVAVLQNPSSDLLDFTKDWPFISASRIGTTNFIPNVNNGLTDYKDIWETDIFDGQAWDGFNADLMKSLYDSPPTKN